MSPHAAAAAAAGAGAAGLSVLHHNKCKVKNKFGTTVLHLISPPLGQQNMCQRL